MPPLFLTDQRTPSPAEEQRRSSGVWVTSTTRKKTCRMRSTLLTCLSIGLATSLAAFVTGVEASPRAVRTYSPAPLDLRVPLQGKDLLGVPAPTKQAPSDAHQVTQRAFSMIGTPYRWGGTSPKGFDCSGLVKYVYRDVDDVELPRTPRPAPGWPCRCPVGRPVGPCECGTGGAGPRRIAGCRRRAGAGNRHRHGAAPGREHPGRPGLHLQRQQ